MESISGRANGGNEGNREESSQGVFDGLFEFDVDLPVMGTKRTGRMAFLSILAPVFLQM